jgi:RNA polymerase sigma-70 factor (ECF subfamily)
LAKSRTPSRPDIHGTGIAQHKSGANLSLRVTRRASLSNASGAPPEVLTEPGSGVVARSEFVCPPFDQVYAETFPAVWRMVRRMGVIDSAVDDVVQEVYVTVYRKLGQFEGRCAIKTWVLGILTRVVNNYRRVRRRKGAGHALSSVVGDPDLIADLNLDPHEQVSRAEAGRIVHRLLDELDDDKASVFALAELEGMSVPEIAEALGTNVNTTYARLRAARRDFERGLRRLQAQHRG